MTTIQMCKKFIFDIEILRKGISLTKIGYSHGTECASVSTTWLTRLTDSRNQIQLPVISMFMLHMPHAILDFPLTNVVETKFNTSSKTHNVKTWICRMQEKPQL